MAVRAACVALMLASLLVAGCGTAVNVARTNPDKGGRSPFGGIRQDLACIEKAGGGAHHDRSESERYGQLAIMAFCAADLPLSLVGDIVTWPYTFAYTCVNRSVVNPPLVVTDPVAIPSAPAETPPMVPPIPPGK